MASELNLAYFIEHILLKTLSDPVLKFIQTLLRILINKSTQFQKDLVGQLVSFMDRFDTLETNPQSFKLIFRVANYFLNNKELQKEGSEVNVSGL